MTLSSIRDFQLNEGRTALSRRVPKTPTALGFSQDNVNSLPHSKLAIDPFSATFVSHLPMSTFRKLAVRYVGIALLALLFCILAREFSYRIEFRRRHHQIGQLWTLCILYYCPNHGGHFPNHLEELRRLPQFATASNYWNRALSEIELTAPGAAIDNKIGGQVVVLRETHSDRRGLKAYHDIGGAYGFAHEVD